MGFWSLKLEWSICAWKRLMLDISVKANSHIFRSQRTRRNVGFEYDVHVAHANVQ